MIRRILNPIRHALQDRRALAQAWRTTTLERDQLAKALRASDGENAALRAENEALRAGADAAFGSYMARRAA